MILIKNRQRRYPVDTKAISRTVRTVLEALGYETCDIGLWFTTNRTIAQYNKQYRHKSGPTDILSFPYHTALKAGEKIQVKSPDDANLGDILISMEFVQKNKRWADTPEKDRLPILLVHGICHLLGYDHENDQDYAIMHKEEQKLLELIT